MNNFSARDETQTRKLKAGKTLHGLFNFCSVKKTTASGVAPPGTRRRTESRLDPHSRDVIVLSANATILLCPPLSPATIKRTPRRQAALRRQSEGRPQRPPAAAAVTAAARSLCFSVSVCVCVLYHSPWCGPGSLYHHPSIIYSQFTAVTELNQQIINELNFLRNQLKQFIKQTLTSNLAL